VLVIRKDQMQFTAVLLGFIYATAADHGIHRQTQKNMDAWASVLRECKRRLKLSFWSHVELYSILGAAVSIPPC
jgi:hypothetical protein